MPEETSYLTTTEFAKRVRSSANAVKLWCASSKLQGCIKTPGGHWRIPSSNLASLGVGEAQAVMETAARYATTQPLDSRTVQTILNSIVEALIRDYRPERVILFGSWAYGQPDEDSDLDLFIIKRTRRAVLDRMAAADAVARPLAPGIPMDIIVMTPAEVTSRLRGGDQFVQRVLSEGRELYAA